MTRGAMMMVSAAAAAVLIAGTAAAISVVNATKTAPTSNTIELVADPGTHPAPTQNAAVDVPTMTASKAASRHVTSAPVADHTAGVTHPTASPAPSTQVTPVPVPDVSAGFPPRDDRDGHDD